MLEDAELEAGIAEQVANAKAILGKTMGLKDLVTSLYSGAYPRRRCACLADLQVSLCMHGMLLVLVGTIERHNSSARAHDSACWNSRPL